MEWHIKELKIIIFLSVIFLLTQYSFSQADSPILMQGENDGIIVELLGCNSTYVRPGVDCKLRPQAIYITNKGNSPIEFNRFSDKYYFITNDRKSYLLPPNVNDTPYYNVKYPKLNPDESVRMVFNYEDTSYSDLIDNFQRGNIEAMLVELNGGKIKVKLNLCK